MYHIACRSIVNLLGRAAIASPSIGALALSAAMACGSVAAQGIAPTRAEITQGFVSGRILVMPKAGLPEAALDKALKDHGAAKARRVGKSQLRIVELPPGQEMKMVERLARHPHFKFAEVDQLATQAAASSDPYYGSAWHLPHIGADRAWDVAKGTGVKIAILDTGVDATHPDLKDRMVPGYNFYDNNTDTRDVHGHGTGVAGAAAATLDNGIGVAAVAGRAWIMPLRIAAPDGYAAWSTVAQALTWAADNGARVANISYVGTTASAAIRSAADYMRSKGGLVIVAAGNNNKNEGLSTVSSMIPVSATDAADQKASFSSWGNFVAMSAPGVDIWTTVRGGSYQRWKGTSLASPVTAAVIALMMARNPSMPAAQIEQTLYDTAVDLGAAGRDPVFGHGRVDAAAAVAAVDDDALTADTTAPTVALVSPIANATVSGLVPVGLVASDNVGVTRVDLKVNDKTVATDTASPFGFSWDSATVSNGMSQLVAVAYDAAGNVTASQSVAVNVANAPTSVGDATPPVVTLTEPADGSRVSGKVRIRASASDNAGVDGLRLELYIDGVRKSYSSSGSLSYTWNTSRRVAAGTHTIEARATDAAGNVSTSTVRVTL